MARIMTDELRAKLSEATKCAWQEGRRKYAKPRNAESTKAKRAEATKKAWEEGKMRPGIPSSEKMRRLRLGKLTKVREQARLEHPDDPIAAYNAFKRGLGTLHGAKHLWWKGGRWLHAQSGYIWCTIPPEHPLYPGKRNIQEHRLVMSEYLGRPLAKNEFVHHRNGTNTDNRLENLQIVISGHHSGEVNCPKCGFGFGIR